MRQELDEPSYGLQTQEVSEVCAAPHYKFKQFDFSWDSHPDSAIVERKRRVRTHLGGQVVTIVRNTVLVDGNHISDELREHIREAKQDVRTGSRGYDEHSDVLYELLEDSMRNRDTDDKPREIIPLMSTYYAARMTE